MITGRFSRLSMMALRILKTVVLENYMAAICAG
jgi:hypothetical protein